MTWRGAWLLFCSLLLYAFGAVLDVDVFCILAALGAASLLLAFCLYLVAGEGYEASREGPHLLRQGEDATMTLALHGGSALGRDGLVIRDDNPACHDPDRAVVWLSGLQPDGSATAAYPFCAEVRGEHELGPLEVLFEDPLGLFRRRRRFACPGALTVLPAWERVDRLPIASRHRSMLVGTDRAASEGEGQEFFGVREYAEGDAWRRIHWRGTARAGRLMVCQYESENRPNLSLFVDTHPPYDDADELWARVDRCAGVGCSIALAGLASGSRVTCHAAGMRPVGGEGGEAEARRAAIQRFFASLEPSAEFTTADALRRAFSGLAGGEAPVAVLSHLDADTTAVLSAVATGGAPLLVLLAASEDDAGSGGRVTAGPAVRRRRGQGVDAEGRFLAGLRAVGATVLRVDRPGELARALAVWRS
ncbi:MAG: DUF58 domain-containing protein [Planctomycetota bacterium]